MSSPIEKMLDKIEWIPLEGDAGDNELPHATHSGVLEIGSMKLRVFQLSDGTRIVEENDLIAFFEGVAPSE
jgi:hypothetical protein